ncbi:MAG: hypothetical protein ACTHMS_16470, partial [Jatrophihabitans sp.]|uniref:hypothetical protein n=1 Tax=Jatrophihabitans sp. TaxID=1932789 RepID=UPI003F7D0E91
GRRRPWRSGVGAVLALGLLVRAVLVPVTHGQDFVVWDLATRATLHGTDVYAHHPAYPAGPYAYFPFFLYVELPFQWLALHTGVAFTVLGKLPIMAGDVIAAVVLRGELRAHDLDDRAVTTGVALWFLNPLVLYDGAWYGRFDSLAVAALLMTQRLLRTKHAGGPAWYAIAVTAKTFPVFVLPGVLRAAGRRRWVWLGTLVLVTLVQSAPYLRSWHAMVDDIVRHDATKGPQALSWQTVLLGRLDDHALRLVGDALLVVLAVATLALLWIELFERYVLAVLVAFLLTSKVVLDQYLVWPLPWLVLATATGLRRSSAATFAALTVLGLVANADLHPFGRGPAWLTVPLALGLAAYLITLVRHGRTRSRRLPT